MPVGTLKTKYMPGENDMNWNTETQSMYEMTNYNVSRMSIELTIFIFMEIAVLIRYSLNDLMTVHSKIYGQNATRHHDERQRTRGEQKICTMNDRTNKPKRTIRILKTVCLSVPSSTGGE